MILINTKSFKSESSRIFLYTRTRIVTFEFTLVIYLLDKLIDTYNCSPKIHSKIMIT